MKPTFSFKCKVAELADVRPNISVRANVFFQHAWLFTANTALFTDVFSSTSATHVNIVLIGFVPKLNRRLGIYK